MHSLTCYAAKDLGNGKENRLIESLVLNHEKEIKEALQDIESHYASLHQIFLSLQYFNDEKKNIFNEKILKTIKQYHSNKVSQFEEDVLFYLPKSIQKSVYIPEIASVVDGYDKKNRIVYYIDGPFHFVKNDYRPEDIVIRSILKSYGYKVISIPYYKWNNLKDDCERKDYIKELIS
jgi:Fe-S-cluster formation regulator IscX/YfhJ